MAEVLLFHHAQGLTPGILSFADRLRAVRTRRTHSRSVRGHTFDDLNEGVGYAREAGFDTILERGRLAAEGRPTAWSMPGSRRDARADAGPDEAGNEGALMFSAALPPEEFGGPWPEGVPLQIHMMEDDEWVDEDLPAARQIVETVESAELFLYPGDRHLFADESLPDYDEDAAELLMERTVSFLDDIE